MRQKRERHGFLRFSVEKLLVEGAHAESGQCCAELRAEREILRATARQDGFGDGFGDESPIGVGDALRGECGGGGDEIVAGGIGQSGAAERDETLDVRGVEQLAPRALGRFGAEERLREQRVDHRLDDATARRHAPVVIVPE